MIVCLIDWLKVSEIWKFWKFNEREWNDFPKLSFLQLGSLNSNSIQTRNPRVKMTWLLPSKKWNGFLKRFEFHLRIFQIHKLYATQWVSWEKIKWLLQIFKKESWRFQRINLKVNLEFFETHFQFEVIWISKFQIP